MSVRVDASRTNRSLSAAAAGPSRRPQLTVDLPLLYYRRQIDSAVAGAKKTRCGLPTCLAILDRWWIVEHRPKQAERDEWERSFECACHFLGLNAETERARLKTEIDDVLTRAIIQHASDETYRIRARVLTCSGTPTRIGRQFVLGLVSLEDYEQIALIEHPDPPERKLPRRAHRGRGKALTAGAVALRARRGGVSVEAEARVLPGS